MAFVTKLKIIRIYYRNIYTFYLIQYISNKYAVELAAI